MTDLPVVIAMAIVALALRPRPLGDRASAVATVLPAPDGHHTVDWAAMLDSVAAGVRAGHSLREAYERARSECGPRGRALTTTTEFPRVPDLASDDADESVVLQTLSVAMSLGGPVAATLQSGAALLRERNTVRAEAAAHAAQARLSARVLTAVPLVFAGWGTLASASFRQSLFGPFGLLAACAGLVLNTIGWWWMRRIVRRAAQ